MTELAGRLRPQGLNLVGAADVARYDAHVPQTRALGTLVPGARSVVVIGNGGGAFWMAFRRRYPGTAPDPRTDPLDRFTREVIDEATAPLLAPFRAAARVLYPFEWPAVPVSFLDLAECAGLGRRSLVGVLVHPEFGPWIALRAAVVLPVAVDAPRPADGFDPCPTCVERSCMPACPVQAVSAAGWDIPLCAAERALPDDPCAPRCHARHDCVLGREHRYPPEAQAFHQAAARRMMLAIAGGERR